MTLFNVLFVAALVVPSAAVVVGAVALVFGRQRRPVGTIPMRRAA